MKKNLQSQFSSRQYMLSRDFEIYYYNDQALSKVEYHTHDYFEFYLFMEGDVAIEISGQKYPLTSGDVVLIPPHVAHHAVIEDQKKPYRRIVFWISQDYCDQLLAISPVYGTLIDHVRSRKEYIFHNDAVTFNSIQSKVFQLIEESRGNRFGKEAIVPIYVNELILYLNRIFYEKQYPKQRREQQSLYQNLMYYIEEHLDEDLSLDRLAKVFYVSKYHIAHTFKENLGYPIHMYITKKRLSACRDGIANHLSISEVYLQYGFKDYSSFFRAFKKEYGMSPKEYQNQIKGLMIRKGMY